MLSIGHSIAVAINISDDLARWRPGAGFQIIVAADNTVPRSECFKLHVRALRKTTHVFVR